MLDSIVRQLAGDVRSSSLDAYASLCATMKAYEGVPDPKELEDNMGFIMQYLRRDLSAPAPDIGPHDTSLSLQALKLLAILVWNRRTSALLTDEFRSYAVDRVIRVLQEPELPKPVILSYLHVLALQDFRPKIMTSDRTHRIFAALDTVTEHVKGNAVICQRLLIYQRLLDQARSVMVSNPQVWMEHMLAGMLSTVPDTRSKAISLGTQAGLLLGSLPSISASLRDVLDRRIGNGDKVVVDLCTRLAKMIGSASEGILVPQIWANVILLMRGLKPSFESWDHFKAWLQVEQRCFNCSNSMVKHQANIAWNRFVYAVQPGPGTGMPMIKLLGAPITLQLERYRTENKKKQSLQSAISSYQILLYYAFRPSTPNQQLDIFWDQYVAPVLKGPFGGSSISSQILSHLLWNDKPVVWSEGRANEPATLQPVQLPTLDCKWVRSRSSKVLKVFEFFLTQGESGLGSDNYQTIFKAWENYSKAIGQACSKEVKPSTDTMNLVSQGLNFLQTIWARILGSLATGPGLHGTENIERFSFLSTTLIQAVGPIPFTEKLVSRTYSGEFHSGSTPHHSSMGAGILKFPIVHILDLITPQSGQFIVPTTYFDMVKGLLRAVVDPRSSRQWKMSFYSQCAESIQVTRPLTAGKLSRASIYIWRALAVFAKTALASADSERTSEVSVVWDCRFGGDIVKLLGIGSSCEDCCSAEWDQLLETTIATVRRERGEPWLVANILEPLADCLASHPNEASLKCAVRMLKLVQIRREVYHLHGKRPSSSVQSISNGKRPAENPYETILSMQNDFLSLCYQESTFKDDLIVPELVDACISVVKTTPTEHLGPVLQRLQRGLGHWLRDTERSLVLEGHAGKFKMLAVSGLQFKTDFR